jgi:hypothetical protein
MSTLPSDLRQVASANPVGHDAVLGELASARARELRERILALPQRPRLVRPRRQYALVLAVLLVVASVGTAIAARLVSEGDVERFLPQGSAAFVGTDPRCTAIVDGVSFRCRLAHTPTAMSVIGADGKPAYKGAKFGTVDDESRVNGGCIALNDAGTDWACYLGEHAVRQGILDPEVLGQERSGPSHG